MHKFLPRATGSAIVKLPFLLVFATAAASAQPAVQFGHRLGSSLVFLIESFDAPREQGEGPRFRGFPPALLEAMRDPSVTLSPAQMAEIRTLLVKNAVDSQRDGTWAQGNSRGDFPFSSNRGGSKTPLLFSSQPSAAFDTWAGQQSSDYAESVKTGFTGIDRPEGKAILRRYVRDDLRRIYVSYEATVDTLPDGTYRVTLGPSPDGPPDDVRVKGDWKMLSPAKFPLPQIMRDGDSIELELYSNGTTPNTTRRIVDYVHVGRQDRMALRADIPRDSYANDAEFVITQASFRVNGATAEATAIPATIRGPVLWVYVPGHGRYILSLHPLAHGESEGLGEVAGNRLTFTSADGNLFRLDSAERIASGSGNYVVHVAPDKGWEPADPPDRERVMIGVTLGVAANEPY